MKKSNCLHDSTIVFTLFYLVLQQQGKKEDAVDSIFETTIFFIDESQSTRSMQRIVRRRTIQHRISGYGTWTEEFEDSFTIRIGSIGWQTILSQSGSNITGTSIIQRTVFIQRKVFKYLPIKLYCILQTIVYFARFS